ncbi:hypothetical protein Mboo_2374 [Methanoregula boonei 6A8]|jgi:FlaG/FlaF family flagellin (archaellin)|uniref:Archaeal Type IV pilin N-terminal domain-containing protein n=1 Tax=Methanoregula boonei (strain DSM 21154 / JCM 14090 / 6A8) TaxID=456442 RepID=A7IAX7_METB6|nr:type IV pilin [Methanoregula boonei]ABS56888.1 hypothetical protein Mboo_2374 [Methanoregula boonei 6A8]
MYIARAQKGKNIKSGNDWAVSPVVGVMLMLVVTIIIAAVVSGFSGGLIGGNNQKAPTLDMDISIANNGYWSGSHFSAKVIGVESGISTQNLKIVTLWSKTLSNGTQVTGGATILPGTTNTNLTYQPCTFMEYGVWQFNSPLGYGTGVNGTSWPWQPYDPPAGATLGSSYNLAPGDSRGSAQQWFGNYNLVSGTTMYAEPFGQGEGPVGDQAGTAFPVGYGINTAPYSYSYGGDGATYNFQPGETDEMMAVLGSNWNVLMPGDTVSVRVIHIPTGKTILQKNVIVEG